MNVAGRADLVWPTHPRARAREDLRPGRARRRAPAGRVVGFGADLVALARLPVEDRDVTTGLRAVAEEARARAQALPRNSWSCAICAGPRPKQSAWLYTQALNPYPSQDPRDIG